jgi:hypothetical protein
VGDVRLEFSDTAVAGVGECPAVDVDGFGNGEACVRSRRSQRVQVREAGAIDERAVDPQDEATVDEVDVEAHRPAEVSDGALAVEPYDQRSHLLIVN